MNSHADKNQPELLIIKPERDGEIETKDYKSARIYGSDLNYFIAVLSIHGGSVRRLLWGYLGEISSSSLFDLLTVLPRLEEIEIKATDDDDEDVCTFKFDAQTSDLDLSRIKSLKCDSEEGLAFFAWLMPDDCLVEFSMKNVCRSKTLERVGRFIRNQTSIKALSLNHRIPVSALMMLTLEKLKLGSAVDMREVIRALKHQPGLKFLKLNMRVDQEAFEEVCKLTELESLFIQPFNIENSKSLEKLKKLKELHVGSLKGKNQQHFFNFKLELLETLNFDFCYVRISIPEILEAIAANFPNLSALKLNSSQKLNYIAKLFPTLEKLHVEFTNLWEHSTGIVHANLRELKLEIDRNQFKLSFCAMGEYFFELFETFPNLVVLEVTLYEACKITSSSHTHFAANDFFGYLNKVKNLKSIQLSWLCWNFEENNSQKMLHDLKLMAQKFDKVDIKFYNCLKLEEINPNYDVFLDELRQDFSVHCYQTRDFRYFKLIKP